MPDRLVIQKLITASDDVARRYYPFALDKLTHLYKRHGSNLSIKKWFKFKDALVMVSLHGTRNGKIYILEHGVRLPQLYAIYDRKLWSTFSILEFGNTFFQPRDYKKDEVAIYNLTFSSPQENDKRNVESAGGLELIATRCTFFFSDKKVVFDFRDIIKKFFEKKQYHLFFGISSVELWVMGHYEIPYSENLNSVLPPDYLDYYDFVIYKNGGTQRSIRRIVGFWEINDEQFVAITDFDAGFYNNFNSFYINVFKIKDVKSAKPLRITEYIKTERESFEETVNIFNSVPLSIKVKDLELETDLGYDITARNSSVYRVDDETVVVSFEPYILNSPYYNMESKITARQDFFSSMQVNPNKHKIRYFFTSFEQNKTVIYFALFEDDELLGEPITYQKFKRAIIDFDGEKITFSVNNITGYEGRFIKNPNVTYTNLEAGNYTVNGFYKGEKKTISVSYPEDDIYPYEDSRGQQSNRVNRTFTVAQANDGNKVTHHYDGTTHTRKIFFEGKEIYSQELEQLIGHTSNDWAVINPITGYRTFSYTLNANEEREATPLKENVDDYIFPTVMIAESPPTTGNVGCIYAPELIKDKPDGICYVELKDGFEEKRTNYFHALEEWEKASSAEKNYKHSQLEKKEAELKSVQVPLVNNFASFHLMCYTQRGQTLIVLL